MTEPRPERDADRAAIHRVNAAAFDGPEEADLVDELRRVGAATVSLVVEDRDEVVGHILFSPVGIDGIDAGVSPLVLGPMAVAPPHQNRGLGSALVAAGLSAARAAGHGAVIVLGHPRYYPRFGFAPASTFGVRFAQPVPDEVFMAQELRPGALDGAQGVVRYHAAFASVD